VSWENDFDDNKPGNRCYHHYHDDDQASIVRFVAPQQIVCPTSSNQTSQLFLQGFPFVVGTRQTGLSHHLYSCLVRTILFLRLLRRASSPRFRKNKTRSECCGLLVSREDRIRTCDPLVPNQVRYRPALLPERSFGRRGAKIRIYTRIA
jgi:hypothetical protein